MSAITDEMVERIAHKVQPSLFRDNGFEVGPATQHARREALRVTRNILEGADFGELYETLLAVRRGNGKDYGLTLPVAGRVNTAIAKVEGLA